MIKFMKKHSNFIRNLAHWSIFIFASVAVATSIADVSAKQTMDLLIQNPELAENSILVKVWYLPKF